MLRYNFFLILIAAGFLNSSVIPAAAGKDDLQKKLVCFFNKSRFNSALELLDSFYAERKKDLFFYKYKSIFFSFELSRAWKQKEGNLKLLLIATRLKDHNTEMIKRYPENGNGYTGLGEYYLYMPWYLGGSMDKAEEYLTKGAKLNQQLYNEYRLLLLYLNKLKAYDKADKILNSLEQKKASRLCFYEKNYFKWITYQRGVYYYFTGSKKAARRQMMMHKNKVTNSYWAYYFIWRIDRETGETNRNAYNKAYQLAGLYSDRQFISRLEDEADTD
ncbi:MAG TPA: hypothetical protein VKS21_00915 [Spirochaetota bacterium]|nr:hypothetical protein [Spirochaetota bacterium]